MLGVRGWTLTWWTQLWVDLLEPVIEDMVFIATSGNWSEDNVVMRNYKIFLRASTGQRRSKDVGAKVEAYKLYLKKYLEEGEVDQAVWPTYLLEKLDEVYVQRVQPAMESFMNQSTDVWAKAMEAYWKDADAVMEMVWSGGVRYGSWRPETGETMRGAPGRLSWVKQCRRAGMRFDIPLVSATFVQDLYATFAEVSYGIQWVRVIYWLL